MPSSVNSVERRLGSGLGQTRLLPLFLLHLLLPVPSELLVRYGGHLQKVGDLVVLVLLGVDEVGGGLLLGGRGGEDKGLGEAAWSVSSWLSCVSKSIKLNDIHRSHIV